MRKPLGYFVLFLFALPVTFAQSEPATCASFFAEVNGEEVAEFSQAREIRLADLVKALDALDPDNRLTADPAVLMFADPPAEYDPNERAGLICVDNHLFLTVNQPFGLYIYTLLTKKAVHASVIGVPADAQALGENVYAIKTFVNGYQGTAVVDVQTGEVLISLQPGGFSAYPTQLILNNKLLVAHDSWAAPSTWGQEYLVLYELVTASPETAERSDVELVEVSACGYEASELDTASISEYMVSQRGLFVVTKLTEDSYDVRLLTECQALAEHLLD